MTKKIKISLPSKFKGLLKPARYYVYYGGRGSAKSWSIAQYLIVSALSSKIKILCTREFQNSITESVHALLSKVIHDNELSEWFTIQNTSITCANGSEFIFKGLAHNIDSIKSMEGLDIVWVEEAHGVSQKSWDTLIPTVRKEGSKIIVSFNPGDELDPTYQKFVVNTPPNTVIQQVHYWDNRHLPQVLREELEYLKEVDFERYLHVWEGYTRTTSDAQIFKGKYKVQEFSSDGVEVFYFGADWGFSKDPTALVRCFIKNQDLYIDYEAYGHGVELPDIPQLFRSIPLSEHYDILADCSRPETISFINNLGQGWRIKAAPKWSGSVEDGIEYLRGFRNIIIHPRCVNTAYEFAKYSYKIDKRTEAILPIIAEGYDHILDSLRYSLSHMIKRKTSIYDEGIIG